jgi:competence protein ComEC
VRHSNHLCRLCLLGFLLGSSALAAAPPVASASNGDLRVYFVDVEGGQATLFVMPGGQSMLIDTGNPGLGGRDADRIVAAAKLAGLSKIDFVLLTHYHSDHTGGVPQLVERFPVGTFIDHGPNRETVNPTTLSAWQDYQKVLATGKYHHIVAHPGDVLPVPGIRVQAVSGDGDVIGQPLPRAGAANPYCAESGAPAPDVTENGRSLGVMITFGKTKILVLGDLTRDRERTLICPLNRLGHVDVLVVSHHGTIPSSSPPLVDALGERVAIMDNSAVKGDALEVFEAIMKAPRLETLWLATALSGCGRRGAQHTDRLYRQYPRPR